MTDQALSTWAQYAEFFNCVRPTAKKRLIGLGFPVKKNKAPMICLSELKEAIKAKREQSK